MLVWLDGMSDWPNCHTWRLPSYRCSVMKYYLSAIELVVTLQYSKSIF